MRLDTLLCPVDLSPLSSHELALAGRLAAHTGASLVVQHNLATVAGLGVSWMHEKEHWNEQRAAESAVREQLVALLATLPEDVRARTRATLTYGSFEHAVLHLAEHVKADLLVMGTHGRSSAQHASATEHVVTHAQCAVLTTHGDEPAGEALPAFGTTRFTALVPCDFRDHAVRALRYAIALAERVPLDLHLFYVQDGRGGDAAWVEEQLAALLTREQRAGLRLETTRGSAAAGEILLEAQRLEAKLVIAGAHELGLLERLFRRAPQTATELLHRADCPVWFVPASAPIDG